jgi:hypothetical protein
VNRIYDQPVSNFPSQTWLTELANQEYESDPTPACVYSSAAPTLVKIERTPTETKIAAAHIDTVDGSLENMGRPILSPYAQLRILQE